MERRIYSSYPSSDIIISPSDKKNVHFLNRGGLVIGSEEILESASNVRLNRLSEDILEITLGNDSASEEEFSANKGGLGVKSIVVGSYSNQNNNVRIHRNAKSSLQFVPGDDSTPEESNSSNPLVLPGMLLPGSIISWISGYFIDSNNGSFTSVLSLTNTVSGANSYLNPLGWWVCDGSAINVLESPIFDASGRHLPNITDERFLEGSNVGGSIGGDSSALHTHVISPSVSVTIQPSFSLSGHYHSRGNLYLNNDSGHGHSAGGISTSAISSAGSHSHGYGYDTQSGNDGNVGGNVEHGNHTGNLYGISSRYHSHSFSFGSNSAYVSNYHTHNINGSVGYTPGSDGNNAISAIRSVDLVLNNLSFVSDNGTYTENRPKYLNNLYIYRVF